MALALYQLDDSSDRPRAKGVIVLDNRQLHELDENRDSHISKEEMAKFLAAHPELKEECLTQQEREYFRREERDKERDALFKKHDAEEDALYERRNAARSEAQRLRAEGDELWNQHRKSEAKQLHQRAKEKQEEANQWQQRAVELTWKHNEEMFQAVQKSHSSFQQQQRRAAANGSNGSWIDLHGLDPDFAAHKTAERLAAAWEQGLETVLVITGAGHHSGKRGPVVKKRILALLNNPPPGSPIPAGLSVKHENDGALLVTLPQQRAPQRRSRQPNDGDDGDEDEEPPSKCGRLLGMLCPRRCLALFNIHSGSGASGAASAETDRQALA